MASYIKTDKGSWKVILRGKLVEAATGRNSMSATFNTTDAASAWARRQEREL